MRAKLRSDRVHSERRLDSILDTSLFCRRWVERGSYAFDYAGRRAHSHSTSHDGDQLLLGIFLGGRVDCSGLSLPRSWVPSAGAALLPSGF